MSGHPARAETCAADGEQPEHPPSMSATRGQPPAVVRRLKHRTLTARRAGVAIGLTTAAVTLAGAVLVWLRDRDEFATLGVALWSAVQTVTTVGYGDVSPRDTTGRVIGAVVMLAGIGFVTVVTATITAAFVESARRRLGPPADDPVLAALRELSARLDRIENRLDDR
jgi:voltage-gated potassium channel